MLRPLVLGMLLLLSSRAPAPQPFPVLHIKVILVDAEQKVTPVPHHALLISDNPASAPPRRVVTALDGTADVTLRAGSYTVESDRPVTFQGKAYQWTQTVKVVAGRGAVLELTAANAETVPVTSSSTGGEPLEPDPSALLMQFQDSVVAIWTPTTHASGFVIDAKGLIATNQRAVGNASSVEVQLSPTVKVAANVLAANAERDVAILRVDPGVVASVRPVPLGCAVPAGPPLTERQEIYTIGTPLREQKGLTTGTVNHIEARSILPDIVLPSGSTGGPVFTANGAVVGITSVVQDKDAKGEILPGDAQIARVGEACAVLAAAERKMNEAPAPGATHLPIEPTQPFPMEALKDAAVRRGGSRSPYQISSADFDVAFITPVLVYGAQYDAEQASRRDRDSRSRSSEPPQMMVRPLMNFSNWSEYVAEFPPVLLVRLTPKLVEGFWTTVARGAAQTQGVSLPPMKHFKSGFSKMRAFCGDTEVTPIHPFKVEQRVSETDAIYEGLYVFDPGALGPECKAVKLVLFSEKEPDKGDTRVVDPKVVQQIWDDFAPLRAAK
jgi:hypothetical protein